MQSATLPERLRAAIEFEGAIGNMWPVFGDGALFGELVRELAEPFRESGVTKVAGIEARGFLLGAAVAVELGAGFAGIRKPGGLHPGPAYERRTPSDYRGNQFVLRLQEAALGRNDRVILVDDWFETGGQASAAVELIRESGATYVGASIIVDWLNNGMRELVGPVSSIVDRTTLPMPD
jgi:adenine phosphoribosyltransferase